MSKLNIERDIDGGECGVAGADEGEAGAGEPPEQPSGGGGYQSCEFRVELNLHSEEADPAIGRWLEDQLLRIASLAGVDVGQISVALVDDGQMCELHERCKEQTGTTDVLSFDLRQRADDPMDGELVICLDEAQRQSMKRGHPVENEVLLYAVHGLLHLIGYDDVTEQQAEKMHAKEDELLTQAGIGPVYVR